jgi:hypothetical protein
VIRRRALLALIPDLERSDVNRTLLSLLDELGRAGAVDPARTRVVAGVGGPLAADIAGAADLTAPRVVGSGADRLGTAAARLHPQARPIGERVGLSWGLARHPGRSAGLGPPDVVWAHGAGALTLAEGLPRPARRAPLVVRLPEGPLGLERAAGPDAVDRLARARFVVVATQAMADHLAGRGLAPDRIAVHPPWCLPPPPVAVDLPSLPDDALVVAGGGPIGWRAGTDLFVALAAHLPATVGGRAVHLVWVGRPDGPDAGARVATDIALRGVADRVHLVEADGWGAGWPPPAVVVVPARESPLPLLALDAARWSVPVVGHRRSGLADVLPSGVHDEALLDGLAADGLGALAACVEGLLADGDARASLGAEQGAHVTRHHPAAARVAELWADVAARLARG